MNSIKLIKEYLYGDPWRKKENANANASISGLLGYVSQHNSSEYMLEEVVPEDGNVAHRNGYIHIHDLQGMMNYCFGMDTEMFLNQGLNPQDGPPKHFTTALSQIHNVIYLISQEIAGAIAINTMDILLSPYIKNDGLTYKQVKQAIQEWVYTINIKGRIGSMSPFTNVQLDINVPNRLKGVKPVIAGKAMNFTYDDCHIYAEWIAKALLETLMEAKRVLAFPVINVGITKDFNWDSRLSEIMFDAIGKIGQPTINNYVSGDYDPDSVRSMCCSLRLDMSKIMKQTGGSFGAANNSGSIGIVTLNLPRYAYLSGGCEDILYAYIDDYMAISKDILLAKRKFIEEMKSLHMYPTLDLLIDDFSHFFNTIGIIGLNEMCLNFMGKGIESKEGKEFTERVIDYINNKIKQIQLNTADWYNGRGLFWNLELIPGEGTSHRFAKHDLEKYPDIITANGTGGLYYTRGCWLPVDQEYNLQFAAQHQDSLQDKFSGGANFNYYVNEPIQDWKVVKSIVKKLVYNTKLPFISISPTITTCPICGMLSNGPDYCSHDLSDEQVEDLKKRGVEIIE